MRSSIEDFKTGWYGITIGLDVDDIDNLIKYLQLLRQDETYHFHAFSTAFDTEEGGVADVQFVRTIESEISNMDIGG